MNANVHGVGRAAICPAVVFFFKILSVEIANTFVDVVLILSRFMSVLELSLVVNACHVVWLQFLLLCEINRVFLVCNIMVNRSIHLDTELPLIYAATAPKTTAEDTNKSKTTPNS